MPEGSRLAVAAARPRFCRADLAGDHPIARWSTHQVMRATASPWPAWRCSIPGARSRPNGIRVNPNVIAAVEYSRRHLTFWIVIDGGLKIVDG
ncbi:hypothetical protein I553_9240 [Mycobacterium xenopi 4042]|uniref:Uncharacterized protein n=1 Tax=Mycobacterium xenopi 4042 TaxID=1299334 RepID=X8A8L9_MYCXE|nr:hypothetical protein I553_9240 [Mycobacterium xenopi 4042]